MFDSAQFNGFVRNELDNLLFHDLWAHYIFNESDLHSAAYYYIRTYFTKRGSDQIFVRCEPQIRGKRPDLAVYDDMHPIYLLELKMFAEPEIVDDNKVFADLEKLKDFIEAIPSIKWGFFLFAYDADEDFGLSDRMLRHRGFDKMSVTSINLRRKEGSGRRRTGYDDWRASFDRLRAHHAKR